MRKFCVILQSIANNGSLNLKTQSILNSFERFWTSAPALLYGLALLLGAYSAFEWHWILLLPMCCLWMPLIAFKHMQRSNVVRLLLATFIVCLGYAYVKSTIQFPANAVELEGQGRFDITDFSITHKNFGQQARYRGYLKDFQVDGEKIASNIPCTICLNQRQQWPPANGSYLIKGKLLETSPRHYILKSNKDAPWISLLGSWGLSEIRQQVKSAFSTYIHNSMADKRSADFLTGIATGEFEDRLIAQELSRFGVQHIMAISGFHFAIVAATMGIILRLLCSRKLAAWFLIIVVTLYFLLLGQSPSIMRAWMACLIVLAGIILEQRPNGLNSLGVGLMLVIIFDPLMIEHIGFQFSFAATAAILLLYAPCDAMLQNIFSSRRLSITSRMDALNQHGYCFLIIFRQALALMIAVNLAAMPLTLFYFQKFPIMGFAYNLFFPFMVSIALMLLIIATFTNLFMPPLAALLHQLNETYTYYMLELTYSMPSSLDIMWRVNNLPLYVVVTELCLVYTLAILYRNREKSIECVV